MLYIYVEGRSGGDLCLPGWFLRFFDTHRIAGWAGTGKSSGRTGQEKSERELHAASAKNQILSELTKMLYSYNLTLNLRTGKYSMIIGNGMTKFMEIFESTDDYEMAYQKKITYLDPEHIPQFAALASLEALRARTSVNGFIGSLEYGAMTDFGEEWHEINVFISTDERGESIANILGRDITESHKRQEQRENQQKAAIARDQLLSGVTKMLYSYNLTVNLETWRYSLITGTGMNEVLDTMQQEAKERELKASAAKDQILSDITKTLYSYNATVNLKTGKYSLIVGTGMEEIIRHFSQTDDYVDACAYLLEKALPEYPDQDE